MRPSRFVPRTLTAVLCCGWLGSCALPPDFEMDPAWEEDVVEGIESPATTPRVVFEPPRFVTLPPGVMPEPVVATGDALPSEPPVEPTLPSMGSEPMPEVAPLLLTEDTPSPKLPELPLLMPEPSGAVETEVNLDTALAKVPPVPPGPTDLPGVEAPAEAPLAAVSLLDLDQPEAPAVTVEESKPGQAPGLKMKAAVDETRIEEVTQHLTAGMLPSLEEPPTAALSGPKPATKEAAPITQEPPPAAKEVPPAMASVETLPDGIPAPGRPHLLRSPRATELQLVDVTGMAPGDKVKCPFTGDLFRVPDPAKGVKSASVETSGVTPN